MPIYDVENRFSYYKSYSDNIMFGSALPALGSSTWDRGVIGSVVSGSEEWRASIIYSDYLFKVSSSFFRSGEVRYLRLSSANQTIEDSKVPDPVSLYTTGSYGSGSIVSSANPLILFGVNTFSMLFSRDGNSITGSSHQRVNNIEWNTSFPFEKKYSGVPRENDQATYDLKVRYDTSKTLANIFTTNSYSTTAERFRLIFAETLVVSNTKAINYNLNALCIPPFGIPIPLFFGSTFGDTRSANSFIFGIKPKLNLLINNTGLPNIDTGSIGANNDYITGSSIGYSAEGWKYGLYNGVPTNFSAVFRQNHYGQFRDMLEQRIYTATYNNPQIGGPMDANGGIKFISGSSLAGESNNELTASIYNEKPDKLNVAEAYRVNPYGSGIFDTLYRASQPWHADDTRITVRGGV